MRWWVLIAWVCLAPHIGEAQPDYSEIYFFGDSLSDTGNRCSLLLGFGYAPGRCSNGAVWSDLLAEELGFLAEPSFLGGNNFSVGGDTTTELDLQITTFAIQLFNQADPDALYVVWIGGNDVLDLPVAADAMAGSVDNVVAGIERLRDLGARRFLVPNLPDIGRAFGNFSFPAGSGSAFTAQQRDLATLLSVEFNTHLSTALPGLSNVSIEELDIYGLVEAVFADPMSFGLVEAAIDTMSADTAFGIPCLNDAACAANPQGMVADGYFLFDSIHPTTAMHQLIAEEALLLVPEPWAGVSWLAVLLTLGLMRSAASREKKWRKSAVGCGESFSLPAQARPGALADQGGRQCGIAYSDDAPGGSWCFARLPLSRSAAN